MADVSAENLRRPTFIRKSNSFCSCSTCECLQIRPFAKHLAMKSKKSEKATSKKVSPSSPPRTLPSRQVFQADCEVRARQRLCIGGLRGERRRLPRLHQHPSECECEVQNRTLCASEAAGRCDRSNATSVRFTMDFPGRTSVPLIRPVSPLAGDSGRRLRHLVQAGASVERVQSSGRMSPAAEAFHQPGLCDGDPRDDLFSA